MCSSAEGRRRVSRHPRGIYATERLVDELHLGVPSSISLTAIPLIAALGGLALRFWLLATDTAAINSDQAIAGLMARHLIEDGEWRTFVWGLNYGGTLEIAVVAVVGWLTGSMMFALRAVPIFLCGVAAVVLWRIGRRLVGDRPAQAAAAAFWVGPTAFVWLSTVEYGFHYTTLVLGLTLVLITLRIVERPTRRIEWLWWGLVAGLGFWTNPMSLYVDIPIGLWLVARHRPVLRHAWLAAPTIVLGALPWLVRNFEQDWPSLEPLPQGYHVSHLEGLRRLLWRGVPMLLGLRRVRSEQWAFIGAAAVFIGVSVAVVVAVARRRDRPGLVLLVLALFPFIFIAFPGRWWIGDGRYLLFAWPFLALLLAWLLETEWQRAVWVAAVGALAALAIPGIGVLRPPVNLSQDVRALEEVGVDRAWADYWLAYRLTFESEESIVASSAIVAKYERFVAAIRRDRTPAVLFLADDGRVPTFRLAARDVGPFQEVRTPHLVAFLFDGPVSVPRPLRP